MGGCTLAGKMEKDTRDLIGQVLSNRAPSPLSEKQTQEHKERLLDANYEQYVVPIEKQLFEKHFSKEFQELLRNFAFRSGKILNTHFDEKRSVDWGMSKTDVLSQLEQGVLQESKAKMILNFRAPYTAHINEVHYYNFGMSIDVSGNGHVYLANNRTFIIQNRADNVWVIANNLADFFDPSKEGSGLTPSEKILHGLTSVLSYSQRGGEDHPDFS